jgi:predicted peptidase
MGGFGTWDLATRDPGRWAAIAPICGGGDPSRAGALRNTPTWVVHGTRDQAVPIAQSQRMVDALRAAGGKPIFTVVEGGEHDVWTDVYADPRFYRWLLEHRRP